MYRASACDAKEELGSEGDSQKFRCRRCPGTASQSEASSGVGSSTRGKIKRKQGADSRSAWIQSSLDLLDRRQRTERGRKEAREDAKPPATLSQKTNSGAEDASRCKSQREIAQAELRE